MVDVSMRDHDSTKARIGAVFESGNPWEQQAIGCFGL
jgi:hypothetical protein